MTEYSQWLLDWFSKRSPQVQLKVDGNYFNEGAIDSLGVIELIEDLEQQFQIRFSQDDFQDRRFPSVAGLSEILSEKIGKN